MAKRSTHWLSLHRYRRRFMYGLLIVISSMACLLLNPIQAISDDFLSQQATPATLEQGQQRYQAGDLESAAQILERVAETAPNPTDKVLALRNLALVNQQRGQWSAAANAIAAAQSTLATNTVPNESLLLAQLLDVQGGVQLDQGQGEAAIGTWQQAIDIYLQIDQPQAIAEAQINQAQAMQQLGYHRQAIATLRPVVERLTLTPDSLPTAVALRVLGDSFIQVGNLAAAENVLESSLAIAQALANPAAKSATALSLGNLKAAQGDREAALHYYQQADQAEATTLVQIQAQLNQLKLLAKAEQINAVQKLWPSIVATLDSQPPSQAVLFAKVNLAQTLINTSIVNTPTIRSTADLLAATIRQAQVIGDRRSESFATGTLGHLYELLEQWDAAAELSQSALALAQTLNAADIAYRWQWQLGRIYKAQHQISQAIAAYGNSIDTLKRLRTDLVAVNPAVQVSFQESVEPIHRELVALLLDPDRTVSPTDLKTARATIESLQLAELDNFFREACLSTANVDIDQLDQRAAVVYPVILRDRLEIILSLPNQPLRHYTSSVTSDELDQMVNQLQRSLVLRVGQQYLLPAQRLYDWIMRPLIADLDNSPVDTLVFVLDGGLRNIPMATLHDGTQFLLERYSVALAPGLQLVNPVPIRDQTLRVLTAGLSESRQGFSALPNVVAEVNEIKSSVPTAAVLLNEEFTVGALKNRLTYEGSPIVHLATHGKFSSSQEDTFILTWNDRLNINTLNNLLQTSELNQNGVTELLVLSACETAAGDKQAALGLAGMAVRSGARSTIATLWQVNDEATATLMAELYDQLANQAVTKADALRAAQIAVLQKPEYRQHPYYWAAFVLVGNWL